MRPHKCAQATARVFIFDYVTHTPPPYLHPDTRSDGSPKIQRLHPPGVSRNSPFLTNYYPADNTLFNQGCSIISYIIIIIESQRFHIQLISVRTTCSSNLHFNTKLLLSRYFERSRTLLKLIIYATIRNKYIWWRTVNCALKHVCRSKDVTTELGHCCNIL